MKTLGQFETVAGPQKWGLAIVKHPRRKSVALCITAPDQPALFQTVAYFRSVELAELFVQYMQVVSDDS